MWWKRKSDGKREEKGRDESMNISGIRVLYNSKSICERSYIYLRQLILLNASTGFSSVGHLQGNLLSLAAFATYESTQISSFLCSKIVRMESVGTMNYGLTYTVKLT
jgi:hypothetical protein